jgi:hypothetical protein
MKYAGTNISRRLVQSAIVVLLMSIQIKLNTSLALMEPTWTVPPANEGKRLDPELLKMVSFGRLPMIIDYLLILFLTDPSTTQAPKGIHTASYYYLDAVANLDPMFSEINPLANMLAVLKGDGPGARDLLEKSQQFVKNELKDLPKAFKRKYWPSPWQGLIFLAYVNIFELDDLPRGGQAFIEAASMQGSPSYLKNLEKKLKRPAGEYEVGLSLLQFMMNGAKDEHYRARLENRYLNLSVSYFIFKTNQDFQQFLSTLDRPKMRKLLKNQNFKDLFEAFLIAHSLRTDPWGGKLFLNDKNRVASTTPREKIFGLE